MKTFGRYAIEALLGQGPVASVYRAGDGAATVALKVLHPQLSSDETIRERFRREALEARALKHPGIVQTYDIAESEGLLAAVEEYCPGGGIEGWKAANAEELEALAAQAASALEYAHSLGAVHRNLKPSNILRAGDGSFKLSDFGSGRLSDLVGLTATTAFLGSPQFVAPESLDRPYPDPRWDLYSLGACLYLAATGKSHAGRSMESLFNPRPGPRRPSLLEPSLPAYLDDLILSLIGPLSGRPRSAAELLALLRARGAAPRAEKECLFCAASMPESSTVCPACLRYEPDLSPYRGPDAQAVLVTKVSEEAAALKEIIRIVRILSGDPKRSPRFMTEDARMYSKAERERYASMPCRLAEWLSPDAAALLASLIEERTRQRVKARALPMAKAMRRSRRRYRGIGLSGMFLPGLRRALGSSNAATPPLLSPAPRFLREEGSASVQEMAFERSALESFGQGAPAGPDPAANPPSPLESMKEPISAEASARRGEGADLVLAARRCLARALSLGGEADAFKSRLMDIVGKASALMDRLGETQARLDAVSLSSLYASMKRLEEAAAGSRDAREADGALREKARILEAYREFKDLERDACLLNRRLLRAASALDDMARAGAGGLSPESLEEVARMLEG